MATIVTRAGKGSPLTNTEVDSNFTNLNDEKVEGQIGTDPNEVPLNQFLSGMAYQDPNNVTIGGGSATLTSLTATTVTGTSMVYNGAELNSRLNPLAQAISVQMTASTTVGGIQQLPGVNNNLGAGDFTLVQTDTFKNTGQQILMGKRQTNDDVWYWYINAAGNISFLATVGGVQILNINGGAITAYYNKRTTFSLSVTRETATAAGAWAIYINGVLFASDVIASAATVSLDNTGTLYINARTTGSSVATTRTDSDLQASRLFNRALTSAEVLDLSINGPALADRGASQAQRITNGGFDTDLTSWIIGSNISAAYDAGEASLSLNGAITSSGSNWFSQSNVMPDRFKRYLIEFDATYVSGAGLNIGAGFRRFASISSAQNAGVKQRYVYSIIPENETSASTSLSNIDRLVFASASTGAASWKIDNVSVKQIGITSELLASNAQSNTGQIFDTSGNKNHAMLPAAGATVLGKPEAEARQVRWTNTWTGTNELQYIGGVNQAVLPAKAYIESIVGIVSGATVEDIIIGDGSDTDRYVTLTTGLAAGTVLFAMASRITDGTNLKLTVDPDANATMSIIWTITYRILE
jgi:hypothetical protein